MIGLWVQGPTAQGWARRAGCPCDGVWVIHESDADLTPSERMSGRSRIRAWDSGGVLVWQGTIKSGSVGKSIARQAWAERTMEGRAVEGNSKLAANSGERGGGRAP